MRISDWSSDVCSSDLTTLQAEDEIAGVGAAIGASFAGHLGVTTTSGPGVALKGEAIGLAVMTELPLLVYNVQRGRTEERRVGKEGVRKCRSRWAPEH